MMLTYAERWGATAGCAARAVRPAGRWGWSRSTDRPRLPLVMKVLEDHSVRVALCWTSIQTLSQL